MPKKDYSPGFTVRFSQRVIFPQIYKLISNWQAELFRRQEISLDQRIQTIPRLDVQSQYGR